MEVFFILVILLSIAFAKMQPDIDDIDKKIVLPFQELPGFWDDTDIEPALPSQYQTRTGRIVGGAIVEPNNHPFTSFLLITTDIGTAMCGGSIISTTRLLTSAHCATRASIIQAILGVHLFTTYEPNQQRRNILPENYRIHPAFNRRNLNNDVAVLVLTSAVDLTPQVQPIRLANSEAESFSGEIATVLGWGRISDDSSIVSGHLRSVQNNIITNDVCQQTYGISVIINSSLCMSSVGGRGACIGDTGGPLFILRDGDPLQVGIVSFGAVSGCEKGLPNAFARVSSFL